MAGGDDLDFLSFDAGEDLLLVQGAGAAGAAGAGAAGEAPLLTPAPLSQQQQQQQALRTPSSSASQRQQPRTPGVLVMEPLPPSSSSSAAAAAANAVVGGLLQPPPLSQQQTPYAAANRGGGGGSGVVGRDYGAALGNLETAKVALGALRNLVADAVFLDEDAYVNAGTLQLYQQRLHAQQRRVLQLEQEQEAMRAEAGRQAELLARQKAQTRAAQDRCRELQQELDANASVFELHYNELMLKNAEIDRLKTVIEGMAR